MNWEYLITNLPSVMSFIAYILKLYAMNFSSDKIKLLIVDKNRPDTNFHTTISKYERIKISGYASNAKEAFVISDLICPDLVLIDITVAAQEGPELILKFKELNPAVKLIICSQEINPAVVSLYSKIGVDYFVLKTQEMGKLRSIFEIVNGDSSGELKQRVNAG